MMSSSKFDYLLIGVKEYLHSKKKYPYPDLLHQGMNNLSLEITKTVSFPKTMRGFLKLLEEPVKDYLPTNWIPSEFDRDFGLLDMGSFSEEANDYLMEILLTKDGILQSFSTIFKQLEIDNQKFIRILNRLRKAYTEDEPEKAQEVYVKVRRFVIENQYATIEDIRKTFRRIEYVSIEEIGELYEDCEENRDYWYCDRCGILTEKNGQLKGLKPRLCGNHHQDLNYVHKVTSKNGLVRIKEGIRQRVCFPGMPELNLYSALEKLKTEHSEYLKDIRLYPGLDRYDIQLRFTDETVWAIDFKDVRNPYKLAKDLNGLYGEGNLRYDQSFYVISDRCVDIYPEYTKIVKEEAKKLPKQTQVVSDQFFQEQVMEKITQLQKGGNV
ncbi:hypothetical protein [Crocosphaera sp.]|uniref:restriction endonuclease-related protein n=1 Tax=Crocosphaera sp. TaxID=2729996 RepID=UPI002629BB4E|nr:hypothetical protein [Crocosphaera sp.]MDJ0579331.1 hypothetical protein [Crocosphaera sp.]